MTAKNKKILNKILPIWIIWQAAILLLSFLAPKFLPYQPSFAAPELLQNYNLPKFIYSLANFDGVHYLTIVKKGYIGTGLIQAFFPVYPFLIKLLLLIDGNPIIFGLLINSLSLLGILYFGFKLCKKWFDAKTATTFLYVLLLFPTSFYFLSLYTESLFLFLTLASIWYYEQQKTLISGILTGLLSGIRLVGLFLLPGYFIDFVKNYKQHKTFNTKFLIGLIIGSLAFLSFILFLFSEFHDPFYFASVQSKFGAGREVSFILLPQVFYRSIKILLTARPFDLKYYSYVQDFVISSLFAMGIYLARKKINYKYIIFSVLAYLLPTLTGNLSSMPRYVLIIFPVFMWWANCINSKSKLKFVYYLLSSIFLIINTILFIQGYWVA